MRERTPAMTLLTMAVSGLVMAGCVDDSASPSPSASAGTPTGGAAGGAPVANCVTGTWRSTAVGAQAASGTARANLTGGSGVMVTIGANGATSVDFSTMQPVEFTTTAVGTEVSGNFTFSGQVSGTVRTGGASATQTAGPTTSPTASPTASPTTSPTGSLTTSPAVSPTATATPTAGASVTPGGAADTSGTWEPVPPIDWGNTRVTVDLLTPIKVRPVDNVRIGDYVGDGANRTGNVVDVEPLLGKGTYQCQGGDRLVLTPDDEGLSWTLTRA
jgi:hypothetical protein